MSRPAAKGSHVREPVVDILSILPETEEFRRSDGSALGRCLYRKLVYMHLANRTLFEFLGFLQRLEHPVFVFDSYRIHDLPIPFLAGAVQCGSLSSKRTIASA
jgi:hypothetical protein